MISKKFVVDNFKLVKVGNFKLYTHPSLVKTITDKDNSNYPVSIATNLKFRYVNNYLFVFADGTFEGNPVIARFKDEDKVLAFINSLTIN